MVLERCSALADTLVVGICISIQGKKSLTHIASVANRIENTMSAVCISVSMSLKKIQSGNLLDKYNNTINIMILAPQKENFFSYLSQC